MKMTHSKLLNIVLVTVLALSFFSIHTVANTGYETTDAGPEYNPWRDLNDDGIINIYDVVMVTGIYGSTGTPINKTALLLELQSRVEALETRISKKGYISISPAAFNPTEDTRSYHLWGSALEGKHYFVAPVQLPHGSTVTNMTIYLCDDSTSYGMDVKLYKFDLHDHHWCIASVNTWPAEETPGYAVLYDDALLSPQVDNQHYLYYTAVWFDGQSYQLQLRGIVIEYEYQA